MENFNILNKQGDHLVRDNTLLHSILDNIKGAFLILDENLTIKVANKAFYKNFQVSQKETINIPLDKIRNGQWNIPHLLVNSGSLA